MRIAARLVAVAVCVSSSLSFAATAWGQDRIAELQRALSSDDFRVRTQAALALGASESQRAVAPLCSALGDGNTTVRAAAASAIGRLQLGGKKCLEDRLGVEPNADVKGVIRRAVERLKEKEGGGVDSNTRFYIAIGEVTNKSSRAKESITSEIRKHLGQAITRQSGYALAPSSESPEQAAKVKREHPQVQAYFVWPKIELSYAGGTLTLRLELTLLSYPDKSFLGSMSRKLSMPDTQTGDTASENELIEMASEQLVPDLARTLSRL
jgi:hypothetical protein